MLRIFNKILLALLTLSVGYMLFSFFHFRNSDFGVFDVEEEYMQSAPQADLIVMDFSRYACPHCQTLHPILKEAIKADGRIKYAPRFPTFELLWSQTLSAATYAAQRQGRFFEMQDAIYKNWPVEDHAALFDVAERLDLDVDKLKADMEDPKLRNRMALDDDYFRVLRLQRTPTLLIGPNVVYTFSGENVPSVEDFQVMFNKAREAQKD